MSVVCCERWRLWLCK